MRLTKIFIDVCGRLATVSWLFQMMVPALCCCCCCYAADGAAITSRDKNVACHTIFCYRQVIFSDIAPVDGAAASHFEAECPSTSCKPCASNNCFRQLNSQEPTIRRRQVENMEDLASQLVLPGLGILCDSDYPWSAPSDADILNEGAALSAADRCITLQRFLL